MLVRALESAKDELDLLEFDRPEDYLKLDDYKVWTQLKECKSSREIMHDLEARRLLKCAYEHTVFSPEELVSNVISNENLREDIEQQIAKKARTAREDVIIDAPTTPSVPYHSTLALHSMNVPVFMRAPNGRKLRVPLTKVSRIAVVLQTFTNSVRVYTRESHRSRVEAAARQVLGETAKSKKTG